ncbi:MAG: hypothetical protein FJ399_06170 [Verrucomicrobia bacterium]|nr:hypothetical protein [Verrucomicrobiota bacterium]
MSLVGEGAVAIWHDIVPEGRDQFYAWHGEEHMPERVAIPGFVRGRRYVALEASLEFFNLYETVSVEVLKGRDYALRLNNPTPWTTSTVKHFRKVARSLCGVAASHGRAVGGLCATLRYDVGESTAAAHLAAMRGDFLPKLAQLPGICGAHLLVADDAASGVVNAEQRARGEANAIPRRIVILEGWGDAQPFIATARERLSERALTALGASGPFALDLYRLQVTRLKT